MTAKEKALELVSTYYYHISISMKSATQCAIIAVDEIIVILKDVYYNYNVGGQLDYYIEVKQELEKML